MKVIKAKKWKLSNIMLTTKEAIERRKNIMKFKDKNVPEEYVVELIESARRAPSGSTVGLVND